MNKIRPIYYILLMISLFLVFPFIVLLLIHFAFERSISLFENPYLILFYAMPLAGVVVFFQQDLYIGLDETKKIINNNISDPRLNWNWTRDIDRLIEVNYIKDTSMSRSVFG